MAFYVMIKYFSKFSYWQIYVYIGTWPTTLYSAAGVGIK